MTLHRLSKYISYLLINKMHQNSGLVSVCLKFRIEINQINPSRLLNISLPGLHQLTRLVSNDSLNRVTLFLALVVIGEMKRLK